MIGHLHAEEDLDIWRRLRSDFGLKTLQVSVFLVLSAACVLGRVAGSPAEASFNFTYGYDPAVISVTTVNYTDGSGTALRVRFNTSCHDQGSRLLIFDFSCLSLQAGSSLESLLLQGYVAVDNRTTAARPAVVIIPDYDGIGPFELWRANLLAQLGYAGV